MTKQADLPGMQDRKIGELQEAAEKLLEVGLAKKKLTAQEKEAGEELIKIMRRHKREHYRYKNIVCTITEGKDKVTVKETREEDEESEAKKAAAETPKENVN